MALVGCEVTIVENAIYHGISEKENHDKVKSTSRISDAYFEIDIEDDGVGFDVEYQKKRRLYGVRIDNVDKRLKRSYGDTYGVVVNSVGEQGAIVTLKIPLSFELSIYVL